MIRISATMLESFRRVMATDYGDEGELIQIVMGKPFVPTWQMKAGTDWHDLLAFYAGAKEPGQNEFCFGTEDAANAAEYVGPGLVEVKATKTYDVFGCLVQVAAQADHIRGLVIQEHKTKFGRPAYPEDYDDSLQWRFYLDVHGAACLRYNLWEFTEPKQEDELPYCELKSVTSFRVWPYVGLEEECMRWLHRFLDWAHMRRLTGYLSRRGSTPDLVH